MRMPPFRHLALPGVVMAASLLLACTGSVTGGLVGAGIAVLIWLFVLVGSLGQTGCGDVFEPCLSPPDDNGPGPCLDIPEEEDEEDEDEENGPGPCLSPPDDPDENEEDEDEDDGPVGPCLTPPLDPEDGDENGDDEDEQALRGADGPGEQERARLLEKHAANLPADVLDRLKRRAGS